jgi:hypothetical protein
VIGRIKQPPFLKAIQDERADFKSKLLVPRREAPPFEIMQSGEIDLRSGVMQSHPAAYSGR